MPGEVAELAEKTDQEGWDLRILDQARNVIEELQTKATESLSYVKEALEKYPGIRVITTQELEDEAAGMGESGSADITDANLEAVVEGQLSEWGEGSITDMLHQGAEAGFDAVPFASAALIGATETGRVLMGRSTVKESLKRGGARLIRSAAYTAIGLAPAAVGAGIISIPTAMAFRVVEGRARHRAAMGDHVEEKTREVLHELHVAPSGPEPSRSPKKAPPLRRGRFPSA